MSPRGSTALQALGPPPSTTGDMSDHGYTPLRGLDIPRSLVSTGKFGWLFPNLPPFSPPMEALIQLGKQGGPMDVKDVPPQELSTTIPAGFTYFGQFLDHNITFDADSKLDRLNDPYALTNFRTGFIDLDHVYGLGPETEAFHFYDPNVNGKMWIDPHTPDDVPRTSAGVAIIADPRNDNTVITIQLHLAFMKFHNAVVDLLGRSADPTLLFSEARQTVTWHYQWIVVNEWLPLILKPSVWEDILTRGPQYYHPVFGQPFIPVEFNVAAYRLHPLVLESYLLNSKQPKPIRLFNLRKPFQPLTAGEIIDWSFFFDFGTQNLQHAKRFEARIADTFLDMPGPIDNPLTWPADVPPEDQPYLRSIAVRNMLRGLSFGLPSGQTVASHLGITPFTQEELGLAGTQLAEAPLWYYIMAEASLDTNGATLGEVGSRIVGEVFYGLLHSDPSSYLTITPNWTPTLGQNGKFTMVDLLKFAGYTAQPGT